jgi:hypothetical protein
MIIIDNINRQQAQVFFSTELGMEQKTTSKQTSPKAEATFTSEPEALHSLLRQVLAGVDETRTLQREVRELLRSRQIKDYYSPAEAAKLLDKAEFTVREWCRLGRVNAQKRRSGRGRFQEWVISHAELMRIQKEGLPPIPKYRP